MKRIIVALTGASGAMYGVRALEMLREIGDVMPPVPAFYALPAKLDDVVNQTVARALELLDVAVPGIKRWDGGAVTPDSNGLRTSSSPITAALE
jgi:3-polyprenyl-4-hydroxybenzoate decarboxylase